MDWGRVEKGVEHRNTVMSSCKPAQEPWSAQGSETFADPAGEVGGGAGPHGFPFLVLRQVENSHFLSQDRREFLTCTSLSRPLCFPVWGLEPKASETPRLAHCEFVPGRGCFQTHPLTRSALKPAAGETGATVLCPCSLPGPLAWLRLSFLIGKMGLVFNRFSVRIAISKHFHLM